MKYILKLISVTLTLIFISSCGNRKQKIIDNIHQLNDSIGIYEIRLHRIEFERDSIADEYETNFPPKRFIGESKEKSKWIHDEHRAYKRLNERWLEFDRLHIAYRIFLESRIESFRHKRDSLKIELYD